MRILFLCPYVVTKTLGGAKVYIEAYEGFQKAGWDCTILGPDELDPNIKITNLSLEEKHREYPQVLKKFILENAHHYDVIEYEHTFLPYPRSDFPQDVLMVARSILLVHHLLDIKFPAFFSLRSLAGKILKGRARKRELLARVDQANKTLSHADLINVTNDDDKEVLIKHGHDEKKIKVFTYGLYPERVAQLNIGQDNPPKDSIIVFIGTFDMRKGAVEFPTIVDRVLSQVPNAKFRLLGTSALFPTREAVLKIFPKKYHDAIEVIPKFESKNLAQYLENCTMGVFPSHLESFGFGVIEMMAASLPVIAYRTPGPPVMLTDDYLVPRGDFETLAEKTIELLQDNDKLVAARKWSKERVNDFNWEDIAQKTADTYKKSISSK